MQSTVEDDSGEWQNDDLCDLPDHQSAENRGYVVLSASNQTVDVAKQMVSINDLPPSCDSGQLAGKLNEEYVLQEQFMKTERT